MEPINKQRKPRSRKIETTDVQLFKMFLSNFAAFSFYFVFVKKNRFSEIFKIPYILKIPYISSVEYIFLMNTFNPFSTQTERC